MRDKKRVSKGMVRKNREREKEKMIESEYSKEAKKNFSNFFLETHSGTIPEANIYCL